MRSSQYGFQVIHSLSCRSTAEAYVSFKLWSEIFNCVIISSDQQGIPEAFDTAYIRPHLLSISLGWKPTHTSNLGLGIKTKTLEKLNALHRNRHPVKCQYPCRQKGWS